MVRYFEDTDTPYIVFKEGVVDDTRDLDENTFLEFDAQVNLVSMTIEHARDGADFPNFFIRAGSCGAIRNLAG